MSGGQRKRASIAAELLTDPRVFFLDEPTSGLDPSTSADLIAHLRTLADRSATVVFTTHSVEDLAQCDRVVFMAYGGRVGFVGSVDEAFTCFGGRFGSGALPPPDRLRRQRLPEPVRPRPGRRPSTGPETSSGVPWPARSHNGGSSPAARPRRSCATH